MHPALALTLILLAAGALFQILYWSFGLAQVILTTRSLPTAREGIPLAHNLPTPPPAVCVFVPAHNEEDNIASVVDSLRAQTYPRFTAHLVLDRCTDDTEPRARQHIDSDPRIRIHPITHCPPDWNGKANAIVTAVATTPEARSADLLLFLDADTRLHPDCISAAAALLHDRNLDLLSLHSTLTCSNWFEFLVQPAASIELVRQYPLLLANRDARRRPFANGQFLLFRTHAYSAVGGHAVAKDELLEDIALARAIHHAGFRPGLLVADGMVTCRMYPAWTEFVRGWKRIYTEAANRKPDRLRSLGWRIRFTGAILPLTSIIALFAPLLPITPAWPAIAVAALAAAALTLHFALFAICHRSSRTPIAAVPFHILGSWLVGSILISASRDLRTGAPTLWRGKTYARAPR